MPIDSLIAAESYEQVFLSAATDAVDAALITKGFAVQRFATDRNVPLREIAAIGDSVNDLPFLTIPELGLTGAPSNAQERVKEALTSQANGYVFAREFLAGFEQFYEICETVGIRYVFADKDGVLTGKDDGCVRDRLKRLFECMGNEGRPFIVVITGSSLEQNMAFIQDYNLDRAPNYNPSIRKDPHVIYAENGAVQVNLVTGVATERLEWLSIELLAILHQEFRPLLMKRLEATVLLPLNLGWSFERSNQESKIYLPPKRTMVTCNIPRSHHGILDYRRSAESTRLRDAILEQMVVAASQLGLSYCIL
jgi:hypothetical protein